MTLVELLVVVTIMVMLVAVSVPMFKPMLESQRTAGAARVVSQTLQRARMKAIQEKRSYGVEFVRFETANNICVQMRFIKAGNYYTGSENVRATVSGGTVSFVGYSGGSWGSTSESTAAKSFWDDHDNIRNQRIQFNNVGRFYEIDGSGKIDGNVDIDEPTTFRITQPPKAAFAAPVVLPQATVVDLQFSGFNDTNDFAHSSRSDNPIIMFSPGGYVDFYNDNTKPNQGLFYLCVGEWDRQDGGSLMEDGKGNDDTPSNFWVTVHSKNGQVRTAEMGPSGDRKKFAKEHYVNIGEF